MTKKAVAAFLSGVGIGVMPAWLVGHAYGEASVYGVSFFAVALLFVSFAIDTKRDG